jgi:hypothetical protein
MAGICVRRTRQMHLSPKYDLDYSIDASFPKWMPGIEA